MGDSPFIFMALQAQGLSHDDTMRNQSIGVVLWADFARPI